MINSASAIDKNRDETHIIAFMQSAIDAMSANVCVLDASATIVCVNRAWRAFSAEFDAFRPNYFVGVNYLDICDQVSGKNSEDAAAMAAGIRAILADEKNTFKLEYPCHSATEQRWFEATATKFHGPQPYIILAHENITAQKLAQHSMSASFLKVKYLEHAINEHLLLTITDLKGRIVYVNENFCSVLKYSPAEIIGHKHRVLYSTEHPDGNLVAMTKAIRRGNIWQGEIKNRAKDGCLRWLDATVVPFPDMAGMSSQYLTICTDITERKRTAADLSTSNNQLRALALHLEDIREHERKRIAREIHDELGQLLLTLKLDVASLYKRTIKRHPQLNKRAGLVLDGIDSTVKSLKTIINDLRPPALDLGLHAAVHSQIQSFMRRTGIVCELSISEDDIELDNDQTNTLFRFLQESLVNVQRHSQASLVHISVQKEGDAISIIVADNGTGLAVGDHQKRGSFGLMGMRERIDALGGQFSIEAVQSGGARLRASIPISAPQRSINFSSTYLSVIRPD
ncbi:MAG: PAS domain-containing protein [Pseudomonadota bacterium]